MSLRTKVAGFGALTTDERRLFFAAFACIPLVAVTLRCLGLRRVQALLGRAETPAGEAAQADVVRRMARVFAAAARCVPGGARCLPKALTLQWLLRGRRIATQLRIGVRKEGDRLQAHAWIEHRGEPLLEDRDVHERFAAFERTDPLSEPASK
ncbi:MAG: lasso peptide biosynthesis B2 protein [Usitatibacter sp.]